MRLLSRLALLGYSAALTAAQPLLRRKLRRRARVEAGYGEAVEERFGYYEPAGWSRPTEAEAAAAAGPTVWLHAVSLGETRAAAVLVAALRTRLPGMRLLLTNGTATGRAEGRKLLRPGDRQVWQPWDTPQAVRRFLRAFAPDIGILMETEVWPNLVAGCVAQGVPLVLANARLNTGSLAKSERLRLLARPAYSRLSAVWAQHADDAARLRSLGAPVQGVFGNLKFDAAPDAALLARGRQRRDAGARPVVLFASSREGEEALWIAEFKRKVPAAGAARRPSATETIADDPSGAFDAQWLVVPRHPNRFDEVAQLLQAAGLRVARRSQWPHGEAAPPEADVWLGDTVGEMALYYGMAHAALLGGSFETLGGQNLIEAAACGCPVVMGPHTFNFADAAEQAAAAGAATRVADMGQGVEVALRLVGDPAARQKAAAASTAFAASHSGASARTADAICALLARRNAG
ncbi:3-deoxy-D-manno-octulosonic acid transferase [Sphingomonas sp. NCPPB 2930]